MSHELTEGLQLSRVEWQSMDPAGENFYAIGGQIEKITVVFQIGMMSMTPWAEVINHEGKRVALLNLLNCQLVELRNGE